MWRRHLTPLVEAALEDTPVVFLAGPRQAGKTTLVRAHCDGSARPLLTLDDPTVLEAARADAPGFVAGLPQTVALDEVQHAPELFLPLKASVDRDCRPGRFLLTGSANALFLPRLADALAGRMEVLTLYPLSEAEVEGRAGIVDALFEGAPLPRTRDAAWAERCVLGGYPEARGRTAPARRRAWFESYVATVLLRDVRDLAAIETAGALPRLLALVVSRAPGLLNASDLGRDAGLPTSTLKRYLALLETLFLVEQVPPWFANVGKRLVKSPRLHVVDSGVACHVLGLTNADALERAPLRGSVLQNFVAMELRKQAEVSAARPKLLHFRSHDGLEVDAVLEDARHRVVAVEIKASASLKASDAAGIRAFASLAGDRFVRGVVFYGGTETVPLGERIEAVPVGALWSGTPLKTPGLAARRRRRP